MASLITNLAPPSPPSDCVLTSNSNGDISWSKATSKLLLRDEVTDEVYELAIRDGKLEIRATSKQGVRQQKIENIIKEDE